MFGDHDLATATRIAAEKSEELGRNCIPVPSLDDPDKWTVGIEVKATSAGELENRLRSLGLRPKG